MNDHSGKTTTTAGENARSTPSAAASGTGGGKLVTRAQAARILGKGYNTVKRREGMDLHPVVDAKGVSWFREEDVRALARRLKQDEVVDDPTKHYDGETAARVFRMLDEGKLIADVIVALELHPAIARAIAAEWADLRGGFFIGAKTLARMDRITIMHVEESLRTEADLVNALETISADNCEICERRSPRVCLTCVMQRRGEFLALAKAEEAAQRARAAKRGERSRMQDAHARAAAAGRTAAVAPHGDPAGAGNHRRTPTAQRAQQDNDEAEGRADGPHAVGDEHGHVERQGPHPHADGGDPRQEEHGEDDEGHRPPSGP